MPENQEPARRLGQDDPLRGEFTEGKALTDDEIKRAGISREGTLGSIGYRIGRNAGETVISNLRNGTIDERQALWIADFAPGNDKVQAAGSRLAIEGASKGEILARMEAEQAMLNMQDEMGLSGGTDLFGGALDNDEFNNFAAKYVNRRRNSLGQDISYLNKLVGKPLSKGQAKKYGINIKDPDGLRKALDKLRLEQAEWQNPWTRRELMDEIRDAWKKEHPSNDGSGEATTGGKSGKDSAGGKGGTGGAGGASMSVTEVKRGGKEPPVFKMLDLYHKGDLRGGASFSVIGKKAKTWGKYAGKAFTGRDDGKPRAEIDASQARLKGAWKPFSPADRLKLLDEIATPEEKKKLDELRKVRKDLVEAFDRDPEKFKNFPALEKRRRELQDELEADGGLADRALDAMGYDFKSDPFAVGTIENDRAIRAARGRVLSDLDGSMRKYRKYRENREHRLGEVLDYPELFEAYPELKGGLRVVVDSTMPPWKGASYVSYGMGGEIRINEDTLNDADKLCRVILHEVQHAIQDIEGFAPGMGLSAVGDKTRGIEAARRELSATRNVLSGLEALPEEAGNIDLSTEGGRKKLEGVKDKLNRKLDALQEEHARKQREENRDSTEKENAEEEALWAQIDSCDALLSLASEKGGKNAGEIIDSLKKEIERERARLREVRGVREGLSDYELYRRAAGEIESRNVESRRDWTAERRQ